MCVINVCLCGWAQPVLQGGRGITLLPPCVFGNGQPRAAPTHILGHYYPKTDENEAEKSGGRFIDWVKYWKPKPWPAVAEIIMGWFVSFTLIIFQSRQSDLQAVTVSLILGQAGRNCLTTHAKYLAAMNKQDSGQANKQWINLWDFNDGRKAH